MRCLLLIFLIVFNIGLYSQTEPKSFLEKYHQTKAKVIIDSAVVDTFFKLIYTLQFDHEKLADSLATDLVTYANTKDNNYLKAKSFLVKAMIDDYQNEYLPAIQNIKQAISYLEKGKPGGNLCYAYQLLATLYNRTGNISLAQQAGMQGLKMALQLKNNVLISNAYNFLGVGFNKDKKYQKAIGIFYKLIQLSLQNNDSNMLSRAYTNISISYRNLKSTDSALIYAKKSLVVAANRNQIYDIAYAYNDIGVAYLESNHLDSALSYFLKSIKIREEISDNWELGYTYTYASIVYEKLKEPAMSLHYAHKALSITSKNNNVKQRFMVFEHLSNFYKQQRKFDSAHFYLEKYAFLKDSFNTASFQLNTDALIASYQFTEKQKAIELLNQVNQNQTSKIKNQQLFIWMSVLSSFLLVVIAVLMIRSRKEKANQAILQAKFEEESLRRLEAEKYQKEKERISRDLHDNVGGQLSYILYSIDGLNNENADKRETTVKNINQVAKSVIDNLRDTIWAINDGNISLYDFCDKLKVHARTMFKSSDTEVVFKESLEIAPDLNLTLGLNLYRICQEILNNAFKYSKASSVQITVSSNERIEIVIEDNGVGFNLTDDKKDSYGLKNIRNRAEESNVIMEFYSETGKGTKYKLLVDSYYLN